jgi:nitric oxide dioxygenase
MKPSEIVLIQESFRKILPLADPAAALFFARLFEIDPTLRPLFRGDMTEQGRKLMALLATVVTALDRLEEVVAVLRTPGGGHPRRGLTGEQYAAVGGAWLWTLERGLGSDFTPAVRGAWINAFSLVAHSLAGPQHDQPRAA